MATLFLRAHRDRRPLDSGIDPHNPGQLARGWAVEKAFGVSLVSQSPKNRKTLFRVLEDLPVKVQAVFTLAQIRRFMPIHHIDIAFCEEQLPDSSYREIFSAIRTVWHYFQENPNGNALTVL